MDASSRPNPPAGDWDIQLAAGERLEIRVLVSVVDPRTGQPILDWYVLNEVLDALPVTEQLPGLFGPGEPSQMVLTSQGAMHVSWRVAPPKD